MGAVRQVCVLLLGALALASLAAVGRAEEAAEPGPNASGDDLASLAAAEPGHAAGAAETAAHAGSESGDLVGGESVPAALVAVPVTMPDGEVVLSIREGEDAAAVVAAFAARYGVAPADQRVLLDGLERRVASVLAARDGVVVEVSVDDGPGSALRLRAGDDPAAVARAFLEQKGLANHRRYDFFLQGVIRALETERQRLLGVPAELSVRRGPPELVVGGVDIGPQAITSVDVDFGDDRMIELELMEGETEESAAAAFVRRHGLAADTVAPLADAFRGQLDRDPPRLLFTMDLAVDGNSYTLGFPSFLSPAIVARRFLREAQLLDDPEAGSILEAIESALLTRVNEVVAEEEKAEAARQAESLQEAVRAARAKAQGNGEAFKEGDTVVVSIALAGQAFDLEMPRNETDFALLASKFCQSEWTLLESLLASEGVQPTVEQCAQVVEQIFRGQAAKDTQA